MVRNISAPSAPTLRHPPKHANSQQISQQQQISNIQTRLNGLKISSNSISHSNHQSEQQGTRKKIIDEAINTGFLDPISPITLRESTWDRLERLFSNLKAQDFGRDTMADCMLHAVSEYRQSFKLVMSSHINNKSSSFAALSAANCSVALTHLTNAILSDLELLPFDAAEFRALTDKIVPLVCEKSRLSVEWDVDKVCAQVEERLSGSCSSSDTPDKIILSLVSNIRARIFCAYSSLLVDDNESAALEYLESALELVGYARSRLISVIDGADRNFALSTAFLRALKCFYLRVCMRLFLKNQNAIESEDIIVECNELLEACEGDRLSDEFDSFSESSSYVAFHLVPRAFAHLILAEIDVHLTSAYCLSNNTSALVSNFLMAGLLFPIGYREREIALYNAAFYLTSCTCEMLVIRQIASKARIAESQSMLIYGTREPSPNQILLEAYLKRHSKKSDSTIVSGKESCCSDNVTELILRVIERNSAEEKLRTTWT